MSAATSTGTQMWAAFGKFHRASCGKILPMMFCLVACPASALLILMQMDEEMGRNY
jgi:hypothetical protein